MAQEKDCRIVFMGTPDFAAASLRKLAAWPRAHIAGVYTQPDRPAGRGHKLAMSAVKKLAQELGIPVYQPASLKNAEAQAELAALKPDVLAVAAYGLILPDAVLAMPRLAPVNVHASVLPVLRGAAPIQRAVMEGWQPESRAGISIMRIGSKLDAGPVYAMRDTLIGEHTSGTLHDALAEMGADLLLEVLDDMLEGRAVAVEQNEALSTHAAKIGKQDGFVDWALSAAQVHAQIRGVTPKPGARTVLHLDAADGFAVQVMPLIVSPGTVGEPTKGEKPGTVRHVNQGLGVACADRWYGFGIVRPEGRKDMPVRDLLNGGLKNLPEGFCGFARQPETTA
ncbi:MAG: methionyl-tRNA formyltransferase [Desulfovibrio sp.]|nr:methionyl-tRNA formyltransferase [Desulfovibrio sp.]